MTPPKIIASMKRQWPSARLASWLGTTLVKWPHAYAWDGIAMERANGVMPEDGGHDSGYQALGMREMPLDISILWPAEGSIAHFDAHCSGEKIGRCRGSILTGPSISRGTHGPPTARNAISLGSVRQSSTRQSTARLLTGHAYPETSDSQRPRISSGRRAVTVAAGVLLRTHPAGEVGTAPEPF